MTLLGPSVHELTSKYISRLCGFFSLPSVVLFNTAFLCHKQIHADLPRSQISDFWPYRGYYLLHMRNSEYSSTHLLSLSPPWGRCTGLPARVRRDLTSAIGIRKAGASSIYISASCGDKLGACYPMGEPLRRLCVLRA
jgi:hypothetical protein